MKWWQLALAAGAGVGAVYLLVRRVAAPPEELYTVTVKVHDGNGPLRGASIYFDDVFIGMTGYTESTELTEVATGTHTIRATKPKYAPASATISVPTATSVTLTLPRTSPAYYGDLDMDGEVTMEDYKLVFKYWGGHIDLTPEQLIRADVNGDGVVDDIDVSLIADYINGTIDKFPIEG